MVELIINADDYGYNEGRTRAIIEFFERGVITSTTLMVNMPYANQAVELAARNGFVDKVGLHLNLTKGIPLTSRIKDNKWFCDGNGEFNALFHLSTKRRFFMPNVSREALRQELRAQIQRYRDYGLSAMHLDSHHHVHTDYIVSRDLFPLARETKFRSIRLSANVRRTGWLKSSYKKLYNRLLSRTFRHVDFFGELKDVAECFAMLDGCRVEVMTHPIRCSNGFMSIDDNDTEGFETRLCDIAEFLRQHDGEYKLISYADL